MSYNGLPLESLATRTPTRIPNNVIEDTVKCQEGIQTLEHVRITEDAKISQRTSITKVLMKWDIWLYVVFYIVIILFGILFLVNINNSSFYQRLNYPNWAPSVWVLFCIWVFTFIISLGGLFVLLHHTLLQTFMLVLLMNTVLLMIFIIIMWFAGLIIFACVVLILAVIYAILATIFMSRYTILGACLQIPYMLFLVLLIVIGFQLSYNNDSSPGNIRESLVNNVLNQISDNRGQ